MKRDRSRDVHGLLVLDKPLRLGSNAVLQHLRRLYGGARAGHTGTLDPLASGVLPVCFGEATKFSAELLESDKSYRAQVTLGIRTSTGDAEGEIVARHPVEVDRSDVERELQRFVGEIDQVPPMHSALKRDGVPLYVLARRGESLERAARKVKIHCIQLLSMSGSQFEIDVTCGKGTYIRALAEDLGNALRCGGFLSALVRTRVGPFRLGDALTLERISGMSTEERVGALYPVDSLLQAYSKVILSGSDESRFRLGQAIPLVGPPVSGKVRVFGCGGNFLGTGLSGTDGTLRPARLVADPGRLLHRPA